MSNAPVATQANGPGAVTTQDQSTTNPSTISETQPNKSDRTKTDNATQVQEVVVTGSRIARPNLDQPTPISTLSPQQIQDAGTLNLGDIISQLPEVGSFSTVRANSNNFGNAAGIAEIDLRNLGVNRTLVLVDGQRHVNGDIASQGVDINSIPTSLVDHVEVITGGASAIYGSDAVSGVVNIILKHNFEGLEVTAQGGDYDAGFGTQYGATATIGHNFDFLGGRMNITLAGFYNNEAAIYAGDLPYDRNYGGITNPNDIPAGTFDPTYYSSGSAIVNDRIVDNLTVPNVGSEYLTRYGSLVSSQTFLPLTLLNAQGQPIGVPQRTGYNSFTFAELPTCTTCYFQEQYNQEQSPLEQEGFELLMHYDVNPHLHASLDAKFIDNHAGNAIQPDYSFYLAGINPVLVQRDNAFITPQLASVLAPDYAAGDIPNLGEFIGPGRTQDIERRTYRIVGGLNGDVDAGFADIKWDGALNYGQTLSHIDISGLAITQNFEAAADAVIDPATGQPACRINVPSAQPAGYAAPTPINAAGCVPYNVLGQQNSAAAYAYSFGRYLTRDQLSQEDANLNLNADTSRFFKLQGGPIGVALGAEYRMERTYEINDAALNEGLTDETTSNSAGGFNVYEGYTEVNIPIFKHFLPGLDELSLDGAYREAHYSTVGDVGAYKVSAIYGPVSWLKFRGTYSKAVRAPNITEAFTPVGPTYFNGLADPCSAENINTNINYARNCAAAGFPAGFIDTATNSGILGQQSGNPDLKPERSLSYTGGFILSPPFIPHLNITLDYYSILIKDAITFLQGQDIVNNCYNGASLSSTYCSLFTRIPTGQQGAYDINFLQSTYVNAAKLYTDGLELQADYAIDLEPLTENRPYISALNGHLGLSANVNYVMRLRNFPFQNDTSNYDVEENGITTLEGDVPNLRGLFNTVYRQGPVQVSWQARYLGRAARFSQNPTQADFAESTDQPYAGAKWFHDLTVRYDLPGPATGFQIYMGVNDIFGETPPLGLVQGEGTDAAYDLGRYIFGGVRFRR